MDRHKYLTSDAMAINLIDSATKKRTLAQQEVARLQAQIEAAKQRLEAATIALAAATQELEKWQNFLFVADSLDTESTHAASSSGDAASSDGIPDSSSNGDGRVSVQADSLPGLAVKLILKYGPMELTDIVRELETAGRKAEGATDFRTLVNSALWRRQEDVFRKDGKLYHLRTQNIEFLD